MTNEMEVVDKMLLDIIVAKVKVFLARHTDMDYDSIKTAQNTPNEFSLHNNTATVNISGKLNIIIIMSFEEDIIKNIAKMFLDGKEVVKNEEQVVYDSVIVEAVNMIIGSSLSSFKNNGKGLDMESPIITKDTEIKKYDNMQIFTEDLITKFGKLSISITNYNGENI